MLRPFHDQRTLIGIVFQIVSGPVHLQEVLGESKMGSVLACQSSQRPSRAQFTVRHRAKQITYGRKYEQKCPQLITGSYSFGGKKVNVNVLHPTKYLLRKVAGNFYLEFPDELLQIGSDKKGQSSLQTASRGFTKQSSQSSESTSGRVSQVVLEKDFTIRSEPPRAVTVVIKGHTPGDEKWLRQERCSRLGSHRSWQCN
jgi:hypothetical protein